MDIIVCPRCNRELIRKGSILVCENCGTQCVIDGTIFDFLGDTKYYWGEIPEKEMNELLEVAKVKDWKSAIREIIPQYPFLNEYIFSNARVDWLFHCLDYSKTGSCLDIGSGWGTNSFALSFFYSEVYSLEAIQQRIKFQQIRQEQDKVSNIKLIRSDWLRLPFTDNHFDLVCCNGVLEWVSLSDVSSNPRNVQIDFLKEVRRVLKPGGCLYIGIENRFGLPFFLGAKDHSDLSFTSLVPRRIADAIVRVYGKAVNGRQYINKSQWKDYRTYTYDLSGYQKLLRESNYIKTNMYWTSSYNMPRASGKFDDESFPFYLKFSLRNEIVKINSIRSLFSFAATHTPKRLLKFVNRHFCMFFLIYAYKDILDISFQSKLIYTGDPRASFCKISGGHSMDSKINYFLLKGDKPFSVVKFPRNKKSTLLASEESRLSQFNHIEVKKGVIDSVPIFTEPMLKGTNLRPNSWVHNQKALKWLFNFQNKTMKQFWDYNQFERKVRDFQDVLLSIDVNKLVRQRTEENIDRFLRSLKYTKLPVTSEQGDYYSENILINNDGIYVIDWEFYEEYGDPLFDFIFFIVNNAQDESKLFESFLTNIKSRGKRSPLMEMQLSEFSRARGLSTEIVWQAIPYVVLRCLHRAYSGSNNRHLEIFRYVHMLELWDKSNYS